MPNPVGPSGSWTMIFEDTFDGTSLNTTKWAAPNGISNSATTTDSSKVSVSGGYCNILHSGMINSQPSLQGWGANPSPGITLKVGDCCEASISIPGTGGSNQYNWPAWWTSGASWPANGECDIVEGYNNSLSALNYHSSSGANNGPFPSGNWVNSFHTYTLVRGSGTNGLKCYWDGTLVRQVTMNDSGGPHSLIVYAAGDGSQGPLNNSLPIKVDYVRVWTPGGAGPPSITTATLPNGIVSTAYSATLAATGGTTPYAWSISVGTLPPWAGLNSTTGTISGTPNAAGTTSFTAKVTDSAAQNASQPLSITVAASNVPSVTTSSLPAGVVGTAYSATLAAAGGTPGYTWSISSGSLPSWASLNTSTGAITGTPNAAGTTSFTVQVTDSASKTGTQPLSITVTTSGSGGGGQTLAYSTTLSSSTGGTLTTSSFTPQTGDIIVVKAVTEDPSAGFNITGTPTGGGWTYTQQVKDETTHFAPCYIWTAPVTTGGTAQTVALAGPSGGSSHWMMTVELWRGGQLASSPATCDTRGTGAPSATLTTAGANSVVTWCDGDWAGATGTAAYRSSATQDGNVQVSGSYSAYSAWQTAGTAGSQTLGMTSPAGQTFTVAGVEIQATMSVATASLPGGTAGEAYSATLTASGGTSPYTWSISSGSLPAWAALDSAAGIISGAHPTAGTTSFTVQVTDANGLTATRALSITIITAGSSAAFVQVAGVLNTTGTTAATTIVIPVTVTTTAGNALIAWCLINGGQSAAAISSVADSKGNSWTIDSDHISSTDSGGAVSTILATPLVSGDTITITLSGSYPWRAGAAAEFSGLAADASNHTVKDLNVWNDPVTASVTTTAGPSAQANELVFSFAGSAHAQSLTLTAADSSSGGTWTSLAQPVNSYLSAAYEIASATHSFSATWTVSGSTAGAGVISYRAAGTTNTSGSVTSAIQVSATVMGGPPATSSGVTITPSATGNQSQSGSPSSGVTVTPSATGTAVAGFTWFPGVNLPLKAELNLGGTWTDITQYVQMRNDLVITPGMGGRDNESSSIQSSQLTLTLRNDTGRFSPKNASGAYYPFIARNTPIRISLNVTSATGVQYSGYRFVGEVSSWPPQWDPSGRDVYVSITASGIWRRISQATVTIGSACARYVKLLTGTSVPAAYWAMEDGGGSGSTSTAAFVLSEGTGTNLIVTGQASFSADGASFGGSDALPQMNGARAAANVSSAATPTDNVTRFALSVPKAGDSGATTFSDGAVIATILSSSGTIKRTDIVLTAGNQLTINGYTSAAGGTPVFSGTVTAKVNAVPVLVSAEITPNGSGINWALRIIKPNSGTVLGQVAGTRASTTIAAVTQVQLNPQGRLQDATVGQLGVFYAVPPLTDAAGAIGGHAGETAVARFQRICAESNITTEVIGSSSAAMGPQTDKTLAAVLQEIEDTDGGRLFECRDLLGLGYRTLASMKDQSPAVTLNYNARQVSPPLSPVYDDQLIRNDWVVSNYDGYAAEAVLTSGAISVQPPPNGIGTGYSGSKTINANSDAQVNAIAQQLLFEGCVDDVRYPVVTVNFASPSAAPLFAAVAGLRIGDYFQVTNLPAFVGGGASKELVSGYTETMNANTWTIALNAIPEAPWESGFSPGVFSVTQAPSGSVSSGSPVGSSVSGSQISPGSVQANQLNTVLSARTSGGNISFIAAATPYDWSFAVSGTPADVTYFIATEDQAADITPGHTFTNSAGFGGTTGSGVLGGGSSPGGYFTVTSIDPPSGGNVTVHFTPDATSAMSSGTVYGGKNGDTWVNTSAGNQVNQWVNGAWVPIVWNASSVIAASSITAGLVAAGQVIAGIVDGSVIQGATLIATGSSGEFLGYSGTPASGNLVVAVSPAAGMDSFGNSYTAGLTVEQGQLVLARSSTPASSSIGPVLFGQSNGALQVIDSLDKTLYSTQYRLRPQLLADIVPSSTSAQALGSTSLTVGVRSYRVFFHGRCAIGGSSTTPKIRFNTAGGAVASTVEIAWWGVQQSLSGQSVFGTRYSSLGVFNGNVGASGWGANSEVDIFMDGWVTFTTGGTLQVEIALQTAGNNWTLRQGSYVHYFPY